jgi:hypothetical protein
MEIVTIQANEDKSDCAAADDDDDDAMMPLSESFPSSIIVGTTAPKSSIWERHP